MNSSKSHKLPTGTVIKAWREFRGMKATQLAESAGLSRPYVSILESNKIKHPGNDQLGKLADALNVSLMDLISGHLPPKTDIAGSHHMSPVHEMTSETHSRLKEGAVGAHVERLIAHADLTEPEKQIVAEEVIGHTESIVQLMTTARRLQQTGQAFTQETSQIIS